MKQAFKQLFYKVNSKWKRVDYTNALLLGKLHAERVRRLGTLTSLGDAEFRVFSQFGEDGILQYLLGKVEITHRVFVEFGVENYLESNTRFLVYNNDWKGLVMDGDKSNIRFIAGDELAWKHGLTPLAAFVTAENIDDLIRAHVTETDIGILSIDIDGNDFWVWRSITAVSPRIVVVEFNNVFGGERAVTVPYDPAFERYTAHYSGLYHGASLSAFCRLAEEKGYDFVGVNTSCMNAFFVRKDVSGALHKPTPREAFRFNNIRMSMDAARNKTFLKGRARAEVIGDMPVIDLETASTIRIKDML